jgi:hypothetical protein
MFSFAAGSGLRGGRTLKEGGPNVVVWCNYVVGSWLVRDTCVDRFDEEEDRDEKEEEGGVMICCVGEEKEGDRNDGGEEGECLPCADFRGADHRWIECIAEIGVLGRVP